MRRFVSEIVCALVALGVAVAAWAQTPLSVSPSQRQSVNGVPVVSATNASAVKTITGFTNRSVRIFSFKASCSAGTATVTITDGGVTVWSTVAGAIGTNDGGAIWMPPLTLTPGNTAVVTLSTCGGGNVGTLTVQADLY